MVQEWCLIETLAVEVRNVQEMFTKFLSRAEVIGRTFEPVVVPTRNVLLVYGAYIFKGIVVGSAGV